MTLFWYGVLASLLAGLATGVGAMPAFFFQSVPQTRLNTILGASAGVMLVATVLSLVFSGISNR